MEWHKILKLDILKVLNWTKSRENAPLLFGIWLSWRFIEAACKQICNERQSSFWGRICLIDFWKLKWIFKKIMIVILITPYRNGILLPTKIVLTYCEKKIVLVIEKIFWNSRLKAENLQKFWDLWNNLFKQWKVRTIFGNRMLF